MRPIPPGCGGKGKPCDGVLGRAQSARPKTPNPCPGLGAGAGGGGSTIHRLLAYRLALKLNCTQRRHSFRRSLRGGRSRRSNPQPADPRQSFGTCSPSRQEPSGERPTGIDRIRGMVAPHPIHPVHPCASASCPRPAHESRQARSSRVLAALDSEQATAAGPFESPVIVTPSLRSGQALSRFCGPHNAANAGLRGALTTHNAALEKALGSALQVLPNSLNMQYNVCTAVSMTTGGVPCRTSICSSRSCSWLWPGAQSRRRRARLSRHRRQRWPRRTPQRWRSPHPARRRRPCPPPRSPRRPPQPPAVRRRLRLPLPPALRRCPQPIGLRPLHWSDSSWGAASWCGRPRRTWRV